MGNAYIFTLQPTFTQGLILGQVSIFLLLFLILKYLFLDSGPHKALLYQPHIIRAEGDEPSADTDGSPQIKEELKGELFDSESMVWLNVILKQVSQIALCSCQEGINWCRYWTRIGRSYAITRSVMWETKPRGNAWKRSPMHEDLLLSWYVYLILAWMTCTYSSTRIIFTSIRWIWGNLRRNCLRRVIRDPRVTSQIM